MGRIACRNPECGVTRSNTVTTPDGDLIPVCHECGDATYYEDYRVIVETPLGARVTLEPAPDHFDSGWMLRMDMVDILDPRSSEVYLSQQNVYDMLMRMRVIV